MRFFAGAVGRDAAESLVPSLAAPDAGPAARQRETR
jgi:hypothetical protein